MHYNQIPRINEDLKRTRKAIISIGCSFVEGQGAIDSWIWNKYYKPDHMDVRTDFWSFSELEIQDLINRYPDLEQHSQPSKISWINHEINNSFVSVLANKYFNREYTGINLGRRGNGNKASIKDLHYYPDLNWDLIDETIVIFCPSGMERYDFIEDTEFSINNHSRWISIWPNINESDWYGPLWKAYKDKLWTTKFEVLETISNIQELLLWCKWKNAKLIIVPAFLRYYTRPEFLERVNQSIIRKGDIKSSNGALPEFLSKELVQAVDMWPWSNMFQPGGFPTFADLCMAQEKTIDWKNGPNFYCFYGKGTPDGWLTPCAHPSVKGHDLFARLLYEHIVENL